MLLVDADATIAQVDGLDVALQGQLVGQLNASSQHGLAVATAVSRDVTVTSGNGSAGGNGIEAVSSAEAVAPVVQTVLGEEIVEEGVEQTGEERVYAPGQSNVNTAETTFNGSQASIDAGATGSVEAGIAQIDGLDLSLQGQLVGQLNLSSQGGLAIATALSDPVTVNQFGSLEAGASGIIATSSAVAKAPVIQTVSQANDNSAKATFGGNQTEIAADADGDVIVAEPVRIFELAQIDQIEEGVDPGIAQVDGLDLALQGQLVGQVNLNVQGGASIATAVSDEVTVNQYGSLTAWDGDGIAATSSAVATAPVVQTATQSNTNSAEATFGGNQAGVDAEAGGDVVAGGPAAGADHGDACCRSSAGLILVSRKSMVSTLPCKGQLVGQINLSGQRGLAVATAISRSVTVTSEYDPASGDGIRAVSSAEAIAPVVQTATQSNKNEAEATFEGGQADINATAGEVVDAEIVQIDGLDLALQGQLVGQVNLSGQSGLAIATALSDPVSVEQCCILEAGNNGIVAESSAKAVAPVVQTASQSNENEAEATFSGSKANIGTPADEGTDAIPVVGQEGVNAEIAQIDGLDLALQGQLVGQINLSHQRGASVATAISDSVTVTTTFEGWGDVTAWDGNGITATSSATAIAPVIQTATQSNENKAEATFDGGQANIVAEAVADPAPVLTPSEVPAPLPGRADATIAQVDGLDVALQGQLVGQLNASSQRGLAVATAVSRDVTVTSGNGSAGGNGIEAVSSAEAVAPVVQTVLGEEIVEEGVEETPEESVEETPEEGVEETPEERVYAPGQSNVNTAETTFNGSQASIDAGATGSVEAGIAQIDGLDLSLQGQLVGQLNLSSQGGLAIATALSDPVTVNQFGSLEAGASGIIATSSAVAKAPVIQTVSQANDNSAKATFGGNQTEIAADAGGDVIVADEPFVAPALIGEEGVDPGIAQIDGLDLALQGQLVGQVNLNVQGGASIATAVSDEVTVNQIGSLTAWDGDGIAATSSAVATAPVVQTATQSNTNSAEATFGGNQAGVDAEAGGDVVAGGPQQEPTTETLLPIERGFDPGITQVDGLDIALQGQLVGQINLSGQRGLAVATAISRSVTVTSEYDPASGDGIRAVSSAEAIAPVVQTATQSNKNEAEATFEGGQADINATAGEVVDAEIVQIDGLDLALQGQLVGQVNLSGQSGLAIATALADPVSVEQCCILEAGNNGIVAESSAKAVAPVVQTASQSNENEAEATFSGSHGQYRHSCGRRH